MAPNWLNRSAALLVAAVLLGSTACSQIHVKPADAPILARDGVFVHIKSGPEKVHSVMMGLRMAQIMAESHDVLVYFDVDGIGALLQDAPELKMQPFGSSRAILTDLLAKGATVYACPGCLQALGKKPEQLLPGIKLADKKAFFAFTRGRILTLDY